MFVHILSVTNCKADVKTPEIAIYKIIQRNRLFSPQSRILIKGQTLLNLQTAFFCASDKFQESGGVLLHKFSIPFRKFIALLVR